MVLNLKPGGRAFQAAALNPAATHPSGRKSGQTAELLSQTMANIGTTTNDSGEEEDEDDVEEKFRDFLRPKGAKNRKNLRF